MPGLDIRGLTAGYRGRPVLQDLHAARLPHGSVTALLGPNGSGKSTLLKTLAGLAPVASGALLLDDIDLAGLSPGQRATRISYMPQVLPKGVHMSVLESVLIAARAGRHADGANGTDAVMEVLVELGIDDLAGRYLDELSGGQKQLVSLAQSLVRRPRLLLLDEPLSALDLNHQFQVMSVLRAQTLRHGLVTMVVLHDLNIALRHSDRAILLHAGKVAAEGTPQEVVTPGSLRRVYDVSARIEACSFGYPYLCVDGVA